jgi:quercetin dioxygenase-like cupin family protein
MSDGRCVVVQAEDVPVFRAFGDEMRLTVPGKDTGGKYAQWLSITQPGGGPPPHLHEREDEWFYVLEGRVSFLVEGEWIEAGPGSGAFLPKGSVHTFKNAGDVPLHMVLTVAPAGFEDFFAESAAEFANAERLDMAKILEIAGRYGIRFV